MSSVDGRYNGVHEHAVESKIIGTLCASSNDLTIMEITSRSGVPKSTVARTVGDMIDDGAIVESREVCHTTLYRLP